MCAHAECVRADDAHWFGLLRKDGCEVDGTEGVTAAAALQTPKRLMYSWDEQTDLVVKMIGDPADYTAGSVRVNGVCFVPYHTVFFLSNTQRSPLV